MSIHVCKCIHNGREEYHLRYPGMTEREAQALADKINGNGLSIPKERLALNVLHPDCHKAADAFWAYWRDYGETHRHGYYESTWGAINRALRTVGVVEHEYAKAAAAAPAERGGHPPLPEPHMTHFNRGTPFACFTADQMRAHVDADRAQRVPLTEEQMAYCIYEARMESGTFKRDGTMSYRIGRAVERAHGIGAKP